MKFSLPSAVTSKFALQLLKVEKHNPQILFASGMVLMGATVVTACRGTLQLERTLDEIKAEREHVLFGMENNPKNHTEREVRKVKTYLYVKGVAKVGKLYLPSIILGSLAVAALTGSHNSLTRRNAGLSAALAATQKAMNEYRGRVASEFGEERELEIYRGVKTEERAVTDDEGRETKSKVKVKTGGGKSPYARFFGSQTTKNWNEQPEYNLAFLCSNQEWANNKLRAQGHLFLNDVHDALGLERTPAGSQVGWLWKKGSGDDFVDFGTMNSDMTGFLDFVTGHEDGIWLDFNVDGEIWRQI